MNDLIIPVSELYGPVIQGEGIVAGKPTIFVRLGGCDYLCSWCDSLYAVEPKYKSTWTKMNAEGIISKCLALAHPPMLVTLSGGNPALHHLEEVIDLGHKVGFTFAIETQGSKFPDWAPMLDSITISPKPPSSAMHTDWIKLRVWLDNTRNVPERCLKVVVFNETDFEYASKVRDIAREYNVPMFIQPGTTDPYMDTDTFARLSNFRDRILTKTSLIGDWVIALGWNDVRVLPQIHALINGSKRQV